jgi:hypothetical protein
VGIMAYNIIAPQASFVQFNETGRISHCIFDRLNFCLPVYLADDVTFQFVIEGTESEIDALCGIYGAPISIGIVSDCEDADFLQEYTANIYGDYRPQLFRLGATQLLVNWNHGFPAFTSVVGEGECFKVRVEVGAQQFCSTCFTRITDPCFTSVVEYGADENAFGFNYCSSGEIQSDGDTGDCEKTYITFVNQSTLSVPYTASMLAQYGNIPTVQAWIYNEDNELVNASFQISLDDYPPNFINIDFGGPASGILIIK